MEAVRVESVCVTAIWGGLWCSLTLVKLSREPYDSTMLKEAIHVAKMIQVMRASNM
eukprot:COSAG05_NODE_711_length_7822_cov_11.919720_11_plen_56_part_00